VRALSALAGAGAQGRSPDGSAVRITEGVASALTSQLASTAVAESAAGLG
jgi:hypothetical protein